MNKHTPAPWMPGKFNQLYGSDGKAVVCYGLNVSHNMTGDDPVAKANAAHIVRCVNSHDALVKALIVARDQDDYCLRNGMSAMPASKRQFIDAALGSAGAPQ